MPPAIKNAALQIGEQWNAMQTIRLQLHAGALAVKPPRPRLLVYDDVPDLYQELCSQYPDFEWHYANAEEQALQILAQRRPHLVLIDTCLVSHSPDTYLQLGTHGVFIGYYRMPVKRLDNTILNLEGRRCDLTN